MPYALQMNGTVDENAWRSLFPQFPIGDAQDFVTQMVNGLQHGGISEDVINNLFDMYEAPGPPPTAEVCATPVRVLRVVVILVT